MSVLTIGEFKEVKYTPKALARLGLLNEQSRAAMSAEVQRIGKAGPLAVKNLLHGYKPLSFGGGVKAIGFLLVERVLGLVEIFIRRLRVVEIIDLDALERRRPGTVAPVWRRECLRRKFHWRAQLIIDEQNRLAFVQSVFRSNSSAGNSKKKGVRRWGFHLGFQHTEYYFRMPATISVAEAGTLCDRLKSLAAGPSLSRALR